MGLVIMRKINKTITGILSTKYKKWIEEQITKKEKAHNENYRYYYDDIVMALFKCQLGVCAYTEMYICIPELFNEQNWFKGKFKLHQSSEYKRLDHFGEMDHFDSTQKKLKYWDWENLFMVHAKINAIKSSKVIYPYLKPDLPDYDPEKYFDYDDETNRFVPNIDIKSQDIANEIQYMIDNVLNLNHGIVRNERRDYIGLIKSKKMKGEEYQVDRFFTSVKWTIEGK